MTVAEDAITRFLDLRALWGGGEVSDKVQPKQWLGTARIGDPNYAVHSRYVDLALGDLRQYVCGRDVLIATHGFNNNRQQGIQALSEWRKLLSLPDSAAYLGLLWSGDSESVHMLSYPTEPAHGRDAGAKLAAFVDANLQNAASLSFVSHSLGARVILEAMTTMQLPVRRAILMAGAVDDHCLTGEFSAIQQKAQTIAVLASKEDEVLRWAFPVGDFVAEIVDRDHPWWESALGRFGPVERPDHYLPPCEIPKGWKYGHGDYLRVKPPAPQPIPPPPPPAMPPPTHPLPFDGAGGWQEAWSASVVSTFFR
jgi:hypothetical protein